MISCRVNVENLAVNEDGTPSEIQPSSEFRSAMLEALSNIIDGGHDRVSSINIRFVRFGKKNHLDLIFEVGLVDPEKALPIRFSSGEGWTPSPAEMSFLTLEAIQKEIKKTAK